eukprot:TRINITY_DN2457_c4_g1_i1.p1 TRINITY_DN2457_c4_g1~~TRINITY_DN2457_c4_g1_i1.p1  ORF type:complete len:307 (-),score=77.27 TRINITY_DN2457_c4_g1_i1:52-867(-)
MRGQSPPGLFQHKCVFWHDNETNRDLMLVVCGKINAVLYTTPPYVSTVYALDLETHMWEQFQCTGRVPTGRVGVVADILDSKLYIFGGFGYKSFKDDDERRVFNPGSNNTFLMDKKATYLNEFRMLNLRTKVWANRIQLLDLKPTSRYTFGLISGTNMYFYGGFDGSNFMGGLYQVSLIDEWNHKNHHSFPREFRKQVFELLLIHAFGEVEEEDEQQDEQQEEQQEEQEEQEEHEDDMDDHERKANITDLPYEVLQHIFRHLAAEEYHKAK